MDRKKLIEWIYENEEMVNVPDDEYFVVKSVHLVYAINNGTFDKEPCEWVERDNDNVWLTKCGEIVYLEMGKDGLSNTPPSFCPNCGRSLSTKK